MDIQISNVFETRRGKRCFNIENYKYSEFRVLKSGDLLFRCTNKKCTSRVIVNKSITRVINTSNEHNHEAHTDQFMNNLTNYECTSPKSKWKYNEKMETINGFTGLVWRSHSNGFQAPTVDDRSGSTSKIPQCGSSLRCDMTPLIIPRLIVGK
ncbi:hypothetical protein QTP88_008148 [Uroleucon formosanum]